MKLEFIAIDRLCFSKANMRYARKAPDVSDILPTVRARGILQPILVRPAKPASGPVAVPASAPAAHPASGPASAAARSPATAPAPAEAGQGCAPLMDARRYEIVAGCRRFHAARIVAEERRAARAEAGEETGEDAGEGAGEGAGEAWDTGIVALPCAVLDDADDVAAIEASLIENVARLDPDEVSRWECFTRLVREGRSAEQIALTFGLPDLAVRRVLALGNLLPRIREMYRREEIDAATIRHLTLASKSQQKAWLALVDDEQAYVPRGFQLKAWLFAGQSIPASHALFDVEASGLALVTDLFGEDALFADGDAFWRHQNEAIEARRAAFLAAGWADAVIVPQGSHFHSWEYEKTPKRKGGRVYLEVRANGEVVSHEGYLTRKEAARLARTGNGKDAGQGQETGDGPEVSEGRSARPELTAITQTYVDLHRHAAVRAGLLSRPEIALRLMIAHAIAGSPLWRVSAEPQAVRVDAIRESLDESRAEAVFDAQRRAMLALLALPGDETTVVGGTGYHAGGLGRALCTLFARLLAMSDDAVMAVLAVVMGETLAAGSPAVEAVGLEIGLAMQDWWQADDAFLDTLRDREVLCAMVEEVAGQQVAAAHAGEKGKVLKAIIRDHLAGAEGRTRREGWVPRWMAFPPCAYTPRGGVGTVEAHARATALLEPLPGDDDEDPGHPQDGADAFCPDGCDADGGGRAEDEDGDKDEGGTPALAA